jgi:endoglucanase
LLGWDRDFLTRELDAYVAFGKQHRVPLFLGEFGTVRQSFEADRGGQRWVSDMLELLDERGLSYAYNSYHDSYMGLFFGEGTLPDPTNANQPLLELLRQ